ncbi:MAG: hypothetical protein J0I93_09680 [Legionella sp.]|nr:hypothetical protein [Legionella sp.]
MNDRDFDDEEEALEDFTLNTGATVEANPSTKLERRRRIEDLFEEKRLKEELADFG